MLKLQPVTRLSLVSLVAIAAQAQTAGSAAVSLSPPILRFSAAAGSNPAATLNLTVTTASPWTATASAPWLKLSPTSGGLTVTTQTAAMLPGFYSASIQVAACGAAQVAPCTSTASVAVTLAIDAVAGKPIVNGN